MQQRRTLRRCVASITFLWYTFLVRSGVVPYAAASPFFHLLYVTTKSSMLLRRHSSPLHRALRRDEYFGPYKYLHDCSFSLHTTFCCHFLFLSRFYFLLLFQICAPRPTSMAPKKSTLAKRQRSSSTSRVAPPPSEDPHRFISREVEQINHESLFNRSFVPERGFPTSNAFFNFNIQNRGLQTLCAPPISGVASVVREFHPICL